MESKVNKHEIVSDFFIEAALMGFGNGRSANKKNEDTEEMVE